MTELFDCVVVGSGPGGYVAAIRAAQLGMRTAIVERHKVGGRCLNVACIPAKAVLRSADVLSEVRQAGAYGVRVGEPLVDFTVISERRNHVVQALGRGVAGLLQNNKVEVVEGEGTLDAGCNVRIGERVLSGTTAVVLATGSVGQAIPGIEFGGRVIGTEGAWALDSVPRSLAVVGAGASGVEIASAYARLGSEVRLFEYRDRVLPTEDTDVSAIASKDFRDQGIDVHTSMSVNSVRSRRAGVTFGFGNDLGRAEWLVVAAGRRADTAALGLEVAGVALTDAGLIDVDDHLRTSVDNVYAIGDLVPGPSLAHKASEEGIIAVETAAGNEVQGICHIDIPRVTFCTPNVGSFGLTEEAARALGHDVVVGKASYRATGAGTIYGERRGLVKIVGDRRYGAILGAHIVGIRATELIQQLVNVVSLEGGFPELARIVHGHPTLSEVVVEAARDADGWLIHG